MKSLLVCALLAFGITVAACLSGIGDRCQVNSDCAGYPDQGVVCNQGTTPPTCTNGTASGQDAPLPIDGPPDAKPDAAPDARPDAMPDAH